ICARVAKRVLRITDELADDGDDDAGDSALLSNAARSPMGTVPLELQLPPAPPRRKALTADVENFTLHADTAVAAHDREGLERLARYGARPPFRPSPLATRRDWQGRLSTPPAPDEKWAATFLRYRRFETAPARAA